MEERTLEGLLVGDLEAARRPGAIVSVRPEDSMRRAITEMVSYEFSQLPVVKSEYNIPGVITWRSLGKVWLTDGSDRQVKEFMEEAKFVSLDDPVLELINKVIAYEFVMVRDSSNRLSGLVTSADLSREFHKIGEPFLLIGSIERGLRQLVRPHLDDDAVKSLLSSKGCTKVDDLVFGDLQALLASEVVWPKLGLAVHQSAFNKNLGEVIEWRNKLVHSRITYLGDQQLRLVRAFEKLVRELLGSVTRKSG